MERRRRAALFIAAALLIAGVGERRPLVALNLQSGDSTAAPREVAQATVNLGVFGLSLLLRLNGTR